MSETLTLDRVRPGLLARITAVAGRGDRHRRLLDLGLTPGTEVLALYRAWSGDPTAYRYRGVVLALRRDDARQIQVEGAAQGQGFDDLEATPVVKPPGRYPVAPPRGPRQTRTLPVALLGSPGTGKGLLFNRLVGLRQRLDHWPGTDLPRAAGSFSVRGRSYRVQDLPSTCSLLSSAPADGAARDHLLFGRPRAVGVVLDAAALERSLALVFQVVEISPRVVACLTGLERVGSQGGTLDPTALARELGVPVIPASPRTGEGVGALRDALAMVASGELTSTPRLTYLQEPLAGAVDKLARQLLASFPALEAHRWVALRLLEGDPGLLRALDDGRLAELGIAAKAVGFRLEGGQGDLEGAP